MMKIPWRVRALWGEIPRMMACRGLCEDSCGPITASPVERAILAERGIDITSWDEAPNLFGRALADPDLRCPALTPEGRCSVYDVRPIICRMWGAIEDLPCVHGCRPMGRPLTRDEAWRIILELEAMPVPVAVRKKSRNDPLAYDHRLADTADMTTTPKPRFAPGDEVVWNGHTATIATVDTRGDSPRYGIFTTDGSNLVQFGLLGRVISEVVRVR